MPKAHHARRSQTGDAAAKPDEAPQTPVPRSDAAPPVTPLYLRGARSASPASPASPVSPASPASIAAPPKAGAAADALLRSVALAKRLQGLEKLRKSFVGDAAHELNTPLTPLLIHTDALNASTALDREDRRHAAVIQRNVLRLSRIVEGLVEIARQESARFHLDLAELPLDETIQQAVDGVAAVAKKAGVGLEIVPGPSAVFAEGDRPQVVKVLQTLLTNALQFTPSGGQVKVTTTTSSGEAVVTVTDTGIGLTSDQLGLLFQPFSRPHEVLGDGRGAGLGLFIAKGLMERQGGRIWAESPGLEQGASFSIALPLAQRVD